MKKLMDYFFKLLELGVVLCLLAMVIMVFGNVVMRYGFNSGIQISEELSRFAFIWLTYLGAMVAMRDGGHLGVDTKVCVFLSEILMLFMNCMFFWGTYKMHDLQVTNVSPVAGISMIWIYGLGYLVALVMGIFNIHKLFMLLTGQLREEEMLTVVETEGIKEVEQQIQNNQQLKKA
jgi:TRAP-type transport system small permease protein